MKKRDDSSGATWPEDPSVAEQGAEAFADLPVDPESADAEVGPEMISAEIREELRELEDLRDRHLRLVAEFENYRKRTRRELSEARQMGKGDISLALLEVLDDLSRFATTPVAQTTAEALHEGVEMVNRKLRKKLQDAGLRDVEAGDGVLFNPAVHEALLTAHVDDPALDDLISRVFSPGYLFGERLLRPAQVEVQQHPGTSAPGAGGPPDDGAGSEE